jgi:hypothetical protein
VIAFQLVRGSAHFTAGSIGEAIGVFRLLRRAEIQAQRHRVIREAVLVPRRMVDEALARLDDAGYVVQEQLE